MPKRIEDRRINAKHSTLAKIVPFIDWRGRRKYEVSCQRHKYRAEVFQEDNAQSLLLAHEVCYHGRAIRRSAWAVDLGFYG